jgi:hypothetical protein
MRSYMLIDDFVVISATYLLALDEAALFQVGNDPLHGSLRDTYLQSYLAQRNFWVAKQHHQHVCMIRQEGPLLGLFCSLHTARGSLLHDGLNNHSKILRLAFSAGFSGTNSRRAADFAILIAETQLDSITRHFYSRNRCRNSYRATPPQLDGPTVILRPFLKIWKENPGKRRTAIYDTYFAY